MRIYFIRKFVKQEKSENTSQKTTPPERISEKSIDAYKEEHNRLGALKDETENIWEERTYQLSAGGLSLTFAVFSFLMSEKCSLQFSYPMAFIWGGYTFCLLLNYLSHYISRRNFLKLQEYLHIDRKKGLEYDDDRLLARYEKADSILNHINSITSFILIITIIFTIVYTGFLFCNLKY